MPEVYNTAKSFHWCFQADEAYRPESGSRWHDVRQNLAARVKFAGIALAAIVEGVVSAVAAVFLLISLVIPCLKWRKRAALVERLSERALHYSTLAFGVGTVGALSPRAASFLVDLLANRNSLPQQHYSEQAKQKAETDLAELEHHHQLLVELNGRLFLFEENLVALSNGSNVGLMNDQKIEMACKAKLLLSSRPSPLVFSADQLRRIAALRRSSKSLFTPEARQSKYQQIVGKNPGYVPTIKELLIAAKNQATTRKWEVLSSLCNDISDKPTACAAIRLAESAFPQMENVEIDKLRQEAMDYFKKSGNRKAFSTAFCNHSKDEIASIRDAFIDEVVGKADISGPRRKPPPIKKSL